MKVTHEDCHNFSPESKEEAEMSLSKQDAKLWRVANAAFRYLDEHDKLASELELDKARDEMRIALKDLQE